MRSSNVGGGHAAPSDRLDLDAICVCRERSQIITVGCQNGRTRLRERDDKRIDG